MKPIPGWFEAEIFNGIVALCRLNQYGKPVTTDDRKRTEQAFAEYLWPEKRWDQIRDSPRLRAAFRFTGTLSGFPLPVNILENLPRIYNEKQIEGLPQKPKDRKLSKAKFGILSKMGGGLTGATMARGKMKEINTGEK